MKTTRVNIQNPGPRFGGDASKVEKILKDLPIDIAFIGRLKATASLGKIICIEPEGRSRINSISYKGFSQDFRVKPVGKFSYEDNEVRIEGDKAETYIRVTNPSVGIQDYRITRYGTR